MILYKERSPYTGRRGPAAWDRVQACIRDIRMLRDHVLVHQNWMLRHNLYPLFLQSSDALCAMTHLKFQYLDQLPYMLLRARDRGIARACIARRDELAARGVTHRVSEYFLCPGDALRLEFEAFVATGNMPPRLSRELRPYEWLRFDESPIEGEHRDLAQESARCHASKFPLLVARHRLRQHIELLKLVRKSKSLKKVFARCWASWKLVNCPYPLQISRLRVPHAYRKISNKLTIDNAYQLGATSINSQPSMAALFSEAKGSNHRLVDSEELQVDYVRAIVHLGSIYSLPVVDPDDLSLEMLRASAPASLVPLPSPDTVLQAFTDILIFRLVDLRPGNLKILNDEDVPTDLRWVQIQKYEQWLPGSTSTTYDLFAHGDPEIVNICEMAPFVSWRLGLRPFSFVGASDVHGCTQYRVENIAEPRAITCANDFVNYPIVSMLGHLQGEGWREGRASKSPHDSLEDKSLCLAPGYSRRPLYFACLCRLEELLMGGLTVLRCDQTDAYYKACLLAPDRSIIIPGLLARQYAAIIDGLPFDTVELRARAKRPRLHDGFLPELAALPILAPVLDGDDEFQDDLAPIDVLGIHELSAEQLALHAAWAALPYAIDGIPLSFEGRRAYVRRRVKCPNPLHENCNKSRSLTQSRQLGQWEVFGFLGDWLSNAYSEDHGASKHSHMAYTPSIESVRNWLIHHGHLS